MLKKIDTPTAQQLNEEVRYEYSKNLVEYLEQTRLAPRLRDWKSDVNRQKFENIKKKYRDVARIPRDSDQEKRLIQDELLELLHHHPEIPCEAYSCLAQYLHDENNHVGAYQIAFLLYDKLKYVDYHVLKILMGNALKKNDPQTALRYYNNHRDQIDQEFEKNGLFWYFIEALRVGGEIERAKKESELFLQKTFKLSYDKRSMCLMEKDQVIDTPEKMPHNKASRIFLLQLAKLLYDEDHQQLPHAISITWMLYQETPDHVENLNHLAGFYKLDKDYEEVIRLYQEYLSRHNDVFVCTQYISFLIKRNLRDDAKAFCLNFIQKNSKNNDSEKLKRLYAWFFAHPVEGKQNFQELQREHPRDPMIMYLIILYAIKIRDVTWQHQLIEQAQKQFMNDHQLLEILMNLSATKLLAAALKSHALSPQDVIRCELPTDWLPSMVCDIPPELDRAFALFEPYTTLLTGSGVLKCLDSKRFDAADYDFIVLMPVVPEHVPFSGFKPSLAGSDIFTYTDPECGKKIDVLLCEFDTGTEHHFCDAIQRLTKNRDFTAFSLFMERTASGKGVVIDPFDGEGFRAVEFRRLEPVGDPYALFRNDALRLLRFYQKVADGWIVDDNLASAARKTDAPDWFRSGGRLANGMFKFLTRENHLICLSKMLEYDATLQNRFKSVPLDKILEHLLQDGVKYFIKKNPSLITRKEHELREKCAQKEEKLAVYAMIKARMEEQLKLKKLNENYEVEERKFEASKTKSIGPRVRDFIKAYDGTQKKVLDMLQRECIEISKKHDLLKSQRVDGEKKIGQINSDLEHQKTIETRYTAHYQALNGFVRRTVFFVPPRSPSPEPVLYKPYKEELSRRDFPDDVEKMLFVMKHTIGESFLALSTFYLALHYLHIENNKPLSWYFCSKSNAYISKLADTPEKQELSFCMQLIMNQNYKVIQGKPHNKLISQQKTKEHKYILSAALADEYLNVTYPKSEENHRPRISKIKELIQEQVHIQAGDFEGFLRVYSETLSLQELNSEMQTVTHTLSQWMESAYQKGPKEGWGWLEYIHRLKHLQEDIPQAVALKIYPLVGQLNVKDLYEMTLEEPSLDLAVRCFVHLELGQHILKGVTHEAKEELKRCHFHFHEAYWLSKANALPDYNFFHLWATYCLIHLGDYMESEQSAPSKLLDLETLLTPVFCRISVLLREADPSHEQIRAFHKR